MVLQQYCLIELYWWASFAFLSLRYGISVRYSVRSPYWLVGNHMFPIPIVVVLILFLSSWSLILHMPSLCSATDSRALTFKLLELIVFTALSSLVFSPEISDKIGCIQGGMYGHRHQPCKFHVPQSHWTPFFSCLLNFVRLLCFAGFSASLQGLGLTLVFLPFFLGSKSCCALTSKNSVSY